MKFINLHFKIRMFSCSKLTFWLSVFLIKVRLDKTLVGNLLKYPGAPKHLTLLCEFQIPPSLKVKSVTRGVWISGSALFSQDFIVKTRKKCIFFPDFEIWQATTDESDENRICFVWFRSFVCHRNNFNSTHATFYMRQIKTNVFLSKLKITKSEISCKFQFWHQNSSWILLLR